MPPTTTIMAPNAKTESTPLIPPADPLSGTGTASSTDDDAGGYSPAQINRSVTFSSDDNGGGSNGGSGGPGPMKYTGGDRVTQFELGRFDSAVSSFGYGGSSVADKDRIVVRHDNWSIETVARMKEAGRFWKKWGVPGVLSFTILLPMLIFRERYYTDFFRDNWFAALMGFIAVTIPSGGAPVAGGVVFLPILTMYGLDAHAAVAFSAATQAIGVGIFTPLSWMGRDPYILMRSFYVPIFPCALGGLVFSYLVTPLQHQEEVEFAFTVFIMFLLCYTVHGLVTENLDTSSNDDDGDHASAKPLLKAKQSDIESFGDDSDPELMKEEAESKGGMIAPPLLKSKAERRHLGFTKSQFIVYAIVCFFGGMLTGWIGIAVEKLTFILLTYIHRVDVVAAGVSSVVLTGFLSQVAFFFHAVCAPPDDGPGPHWRCAIQWIDNPDGYVSGNVPYKLWMAVLPGLLLGTLFGPWCNAKIGPKNVMIVFCIFLVFDIVESINDLFF